MYKINFVNLICMNKTINMLFITLKMAVQKIGRRQSKNYNINYCKADVLHGWA